MKALILAAGKGSRLGDKTLETPKSLTNLWGEPLFDRQLRLLNNIGITDIAVVTGYLSHCFADYPVKHFHNPEYHESNMVYSLMSARDFWLAGDQPVLILYGDIAYNEAVLQQIVANDAELLVPGNNRWLELWQQRMSEPMSDAESFIYHKETMVLQQLGQPLTALEQAMAQYMGMIKLGVQGQSQIRELLTQTSSEQLRHWAMTDFIQAWIDADLRVDTCECPGGWIELDTLDDWELYHQHRADFFNLTS